jgi:hypothetical protein
MYKQILLFTALIIGMALIGACSAFNTTDTAGTAVAQATSLVAEATTIRQTIQAQAAQVEATALAAETYVMEREAINAQLLATMRAAIPPTQQVIQQNDGGTPGLNDVPNVQGDGNTADAGIGTRFTQVVTTDAVSDADGCAIGSRTSFTSSDARIYIVTRALNITAGTEMSAEWSYEGTVVYDLDVFTVTENDDDFCLWFYIDPESVTFSPGSWSVQLFANGVAVEPALTFTIA